MKNIDFLNPSERGKKYAKELKNKKRYCNDMTTIKKASLTSNEASYRMGYLQARKDATAIWKANKEKHCNPSYNVKKKKASMPRKLDKYEIENNKKNPMDGMDVL